MAEIEVDVQDTARRAIHNPGVPLDPKKVQFKYNTLGYQIERTNPQGVVTKYVPNDLGEVNQVVHDPGGVNLTSTTQYGPVGEVVQEQRTHEGSQTPLITNRYGYSNRGVVLNHESQVESIKLRERFEWDENDQLTGYHPPDAESGAHAGSYVKYEYDELKHRVVRKELAGNSPPVVTTLQYTPSWLDLKTITDPAGQDTTYRPDDFGETTGVTGTLGEESQSNLDDTGLPSVHYTRGGPQAKQTTGFLEVVRGRDLRVKRFQQGRFSLGRSGGGPAPGKSPSQLGLGIAEEYLSSTGHALNTGPAGLHLGRQVTEVSRDVHGPGDPLGAPRLGGGARCLRCVGPTA